MEVIENLVDHSRVVNQLKRTSEAAVQVGQAYMKTVQKENLSAVNEALNELYVEDEDYESLRQSIDDYNNFNMIGLATKLATHELLEFRRISAYVYRCHKKWSKSIELSKNDRMYKDAIDTANESSDSAIIESLLRFFCDISEKECFCAALYTCYSHISPDLALELGWLNGYHNFVMPFLIQNLRHTHYRLKELESRTEPPKEDENAQDTIASTYGNLGGFNPGVLMLENGAGMMAPPQMQPSPTSLDMSGFPSANPMGMMSNGGMMPPTGQPGMQSMSSL
jgi:clathrin heavy chain